MKQLTFVQNNFFRDLANQTTEIVGVQSNLQSKENYRSDNMRLERKFVSKSEKIEAFTPCFCSVFLKTKIVSELYRNFGKKSHIIR